MTAGVNPERWCILRTSPMRTLKLAASLSEAGIETWAPSRIERRKGRGRGRNDVTEVAVAIAPGFAFAPAAHVSALLAVRAMPISPHPAFSLLRAADGHIPTIMDRSLDPMRAIEERFRRALLKSTKQQLEVGSTVQMKTGGFAGLIGEVKLGTKPGNKGKHVVDLGGLFGEVEIASYLIGTDVLLPAPQPAMAIAA